MTGRSVEFSTQGFGRPHPEHAWFSGPRLASGTWKGRQVLFAHTECSLRLQHRQRRLSERHTAIFSITELEASVALPNRQGPTSRPSFKSPQCQAISGLPGAGRRRKAGDLSAVLMNPGERRAVFPGVCVLAVIRLKRGCPGAVPMAYRRVMHVRRDARAGPQVDGLKCSMSLLATARGRPVGARRGRDLHHFGVCVGGRGVRRRAGRRLRR